MEMCCWRLYNFKITYILSSVRLSEYRFLIPTVVLLQISSLHCFK
uniref:Uncharacterized protein n=1 Tax=Ciona intestinalis TaxID=7719 RepID=H2XSP9_CIOIN